VPLDDSGREVSRIDLVPGEHLGHLGHLHRELGAGDPGQLARDMVALNLDRRLAMAEQDKTQPADRVLENDLEVPTQLPDLPGGEVIEHHDPRAAPAQERPQHGQRVPPAALVRTHVRDRDDRALTGLVQGVAQERPEKIRIGPLAGDVQPDQPTGQLGGRGPLGDGLGLAPPGRRGDQRQQSRHTEIEQVGNTWPRDHPGRHIRQHPRGQGTLRQEH
jgi:hypothetical protein